MAKRTLKEEIGQSADFASKEAEVIRDRLRTTEALSAKPLALLRGEGLSHSQYNVLRILRGAGSPGCSCRDIVERMVTRDSDMTRLLDGLEKKSLVKRRRSDADRRVIMVQVSTAGLRLLKKLDAPLQQLHVEQLSHLGEKGLQLLSRLLEEARES